MKTTVINIRDAPEGWTRDPQYVYVGRARRGFDGYFGNPEPLRSSTDKERRENLARYCAYLQRRVRTDDEFAKRVVGLRGKTLVCFCKPKACHGDSLAAMADVLQLPMVLVRRRKSRQ